MFRLSASPLIHPASSIVLIVSITINAASMLLESAGVISLANANYLFTLYVQYCNYALSMVFCLLLHCGY